MAGRRSSGDESADALFFYPQDVQGLPDGRSKAQDTQHMHGRYMRLTKVLLGHVRGLWWMRRLLVSSGLFQRKLSAAPVRHALQRCKTEPNVPEEEERL